VFIHSFTIYSFKVPVIMFVSGFQGGNKTDLVPVLMEHSL
jgi:hypothetical protein